MSVDSKISLMLGIIIIGSIITGSIDPILGITFSHVESINKILHQVMYMAFGGSVTALFLKK